VTSTDTQAMPQDRPRDQATPAATPPPVAMRIAEIDCSSAGARGKGMTTRAPEGSTCTEAAEAVIVGMPDGTAVVIHDTAPDMTARKKQIESDTTSKFKSYATDTPETVVYEVVAANGKTGYNFVTTKKVGDKVITCEGQKGASYTRAQAEQLVMTCQAIEKKP
jgi:hypothetical protein